MRLPALLFILIALFAACSGSKPVSNSTSTLNPPLKKDGEYPAAGKITKIDDKIGSIELDHKDIPGLMPAMKMEFYVTDRSLLTGVAVGDEVDFTILYQGGTEKINKISKAK